MSKLRRHGTHLTILIALSVCTSEATPLIVARTQQGFVIGTNIKGSDGSLGCKLHTTKNAIVIEANDFSRLDTVTKGVRRTRVDFQADLERDLEHKDNLDLSELQNVVIEGTMESLIKEMTQLTAVV
jgi:hypothetical protein